MKTRHYKGDLHALLKWAVNRNDCAPPEPFQSWVRNLMPENCRGNIGYHVIALTPDSPAADGWHKGFPHSHITSVDWQPETTSAVTYLATPERGGEFGLGGLRKNDPYEFIDPEPGMTVMCDATQWHGVRQVLQGTRIALVTSGPPA